MTKKRAPLARSGIITDLKETKCLPFIRIFYKIILTRVLFASGAGCATELMHHPESAPGKLDDELTVDASGEEFFTHFTPTDHSAPDFTFRQASRMTLPSLKTASSNGKMAAGTRILTLWAFPFLFCGLFNS